MANVNGYPEDAENRPRPVGGNDVSHNVSTSTGQVFSGTDSLTADLCRKLHRTMVRARAMEERMIKMAKSGEGFFWIGGPGEEAFNSCLGYQIRKGEGPTFDYLHLHYRNSATLVAMGMELADGIRQMAMTRTDPFSYGRNFTGHYSRKAWNVVPITSVIEVQYAMAPGTALVQKRIPGNDAITIVTGGDAGTAEGDFASCMVWSSRPGNELPVLMVVMNNGWGISTPCCSIYGDRQIIERGKGFHIPGEVVDGNDPIASWHAIKRGIEHVRTTRRPFMIEATVSRLYGHSSSSGAQRVANEPDCIALFEERMLAANAMTTAEISRVHDETKAEIEDALQRVLREERPRPEDIVRGTYAPSDVDAVYPHEFTGLPN
jgi:2-oxoisovalerate dehydrogenase E1 component alpha subunit